MKLRYPIYVRTTAFIMLFAIFHYVAGYRFMYSLGILYAKDEAKVCMTEKADIKKLNFSAEDYSSLKWNEKNKEFSCNNQMYDVVNITKSGNIYCISVYADDPETELLATFHNFEKQFFHPDQTNKSTKSAEDVISAFQKDFTPAGEFKISLFSSNKLLHPIVAIQQPLVRASDNIWHPPTC